MIVDLHVRATYCHFIFFVEMETRKMFVFVVKRYAVREAKIGQYAVRNGGGGVTLNNNKFNTLIISAQSRILLLTLADPGGGAPGARPPPNGRGPMIFYAQNAIFSQFFRRSLRSRFFLSLILIEIWPKHAEIDFYFNPSTLSMIFYPPPVDKVHAPPKVKSWTRHWLMFIQIVYYVCDWHYMFVSKIVLICNKSLNSLLKCVYKLVC